MPDDNLDPPPHWKKRLQRYLEEQGDAAQFLREPEMPNHPWPSLDNPMVGYLIERGAEFVEESGALKGVAWAVPHAWREGAIAERARIIAMLSSEEEFI